MLSKTSRTLALCWLDQKLVDITEIRQTKYCAFSCQSPDECEYLINMAKPHMVKSTVVDSETGNSKDSRYGIS